MTDIRLTTEDLADILLGVFADQLGDSKEIEIAALRIHWRGIGLRIDDLIQALVVLARDGRVKLRGIGDTAAIRLSPEALRGLAMPGQGITSLPPRLRAVLEVAGKRASKSDFGAIRGNQRKGLG